MDTLAYLHLAATYESSANPEPRTDLSYGLLFQVLDSTKCRSAASIPLFFFAIALFTVSFARPSLALEKGNSSPEVTSLQKKLQSAGYFDGPVTGYYGSLTQEAVVKFQQAKGLTTNGIADEVTLKALESGTLASVPSQPVTSPSGFTDGAKVTASPTLGLEKGNRSPEVSSLQKKLQAAGYFDGPATGYYGSLTQEAVSKFQQAKGLTANGIADEATLKALESSSGASAPSKPAISQKVVTANPNKVQASPTQSLEKGNKTPEVTPSPAQSLEKGNKTPEVTPSPTLGLEKGNRSPEVTSLQKKLQAAGYFDGPLTGYYGSLTQEAVSKFQQAKGLTTNGIADEATLKALESGSAASAPSQPAAPPKVVTDDPNKVSRRPTVELERGNRSSLVTSLQKKLQAAGYFDGPATGYYGPLTQEAVSKFQQAKGLTANGIADEATLKALESGSGASAPSQPATPQKVVTDGSKVENQGNLGNPQKATPPVQNTPQKATPPVQNTPQKATPSVQNTPQAASPSLQSEMKLKKTIYGKISPKSVVHSGTGLFFAQNMMYSHTITVYDRKYNLVKTIPDTVNLTKYGYSKLKGKYQGAPVETAFSHNGKYAWVSNYQMYGPEFNNPGSDECSPSQGTDKSFLYRINTESLGVEKVIQVGSVPKFVAASPDNRLVLVSNWCSWDLSVVDTEKNKEIKRVELGRYPRGIVVDSNSEKAYIAVMGSYDIARIDLKDFSLGWLSGIGQSPRHLNIDPADKYLYATLNGEGTVAKIDLSKGKVLDKVVTGNAPRSMVISDDGQVLYVVNYNSNTVSKVRTSDMKVLQTVDVNDAPIGITYDPQTREVWVACYSGSILVFQG